MSSLGGERRGGDRRRNDRRRNGRRRDDQGASTQASGSGQGDSLFDPGWLAAGDRLPDSLRATQAARQAAMAQGNALARVFRGYAAARAAIGVALVVAEGAGRLIGVRAGEWTALVCLVYAVQAIVLWLLPRYGALAEAPLTLAQRRRQWVLTIGVDLVAFSMLRVLEPSSSFNYGALLVLPVLMAGVMTSRLLALATAAAVSLLLLVAAWDGALSDAPASGLMLQTGLAGLGLFVIALLAGELAARLAREELAARGSMELARQQAQLNRLVIEEMADGVLVVDPGLRVRAANPAARALLVDEGLSPPAPFNLGERLSWARLAREVTSAFESGNWPEAGRDLAVDFDGGVSRTLRVRVRFTRSGVLSLPRAVPAGEAAGTATHEEPFVVLLLEDVRTAMARLQQEKLAAMGRVSAGIAHEFRNPLAAIAQANALLQEDELAPTQQRLARIVADNVARLKRLVDDVMEVAPGAAQALGAIDAHAVVAAVVAEWAATAGVSVAASASPDGSPGRSAADAAPTADSAHAAPASVARLRLALPPRAAGRSAAAAPAVVFDAEHLRRVLVNLLDNAHRHASTAPGAIGLKLLPRDDGSVQLWVQSDGEPIAPDVERYLFEPFFSTRSRGTGLGLYICRELCERYGATIDYRAMPASEKLRNAFVVTMRPAPPADAAAPSSSHPLQP